MNINNKLDSNYFDDDRLFDVLEQDDFKAILDFLNDYGLNSYDRDERTMLINLIVENKIEFIKELLKHNPDVEHQDINGQTALHFAVQEELVEVVNLLLSYPSIKLNTKDNWGNTPLWRAIMNEVEQSIIISLLEKGADLNIKNDSDVAPIDLLDEALPRVQKWIKENGNVTN